MTIICAIQTRAGTWIGGDSRVSTDVDAHDTVKKWALGMGWAVGCSGHLRTINLLEANARRIFAGLETPFEFTRRVRSIMRDDGYQTQHEPDESGPAEYGQYMILAHASGVWQIGCDFSIIQHRRDAFVAEGSGGPIAAGAYYAAEQRLKPEQAMRTAIKAAIRFDPHCGGRVFIHKMEA